MQSANRFSALESDDEVEVPQVPVKKQTNEKKVEKKTEKKQQQQQVPVKQEQEKKPKNKNEGVEMEYKKPDSRRGTDHTSREGYVPRQGKRQFDRHDGTGRGSKISKKEGAGQHNWGNELEDELNNINGVDEISQVPASEKENIEKSEQIGKGIEEETSEKTEQPSEQATAKPQVEKQLTLEEFRKQQQEARKGYQNKDLFAVRHERNADILADEEVHKITGSGDDDLIKASVTTKAKKKKVQRSQKTVVLEKDAIGFSQNARRLPRADKPRTEGGEQQKEKKHDHHQQNNEQRREGGGDRGAFRGRGRGDFGRGRGRGQRGGPSKIDIEDVKSFPVLKA